MTLYLKVLGIKGMTINVHYSFSTRKEESMSMVARLELLFLLNSNHQHSHGMKALISTVRKMISWYLKSARSECTIKSSKLVVISTHPM